MRKSVVALILITLVFTAALALADRPLYQMQIKVSDRYQRTDIANTGVDFLSVEDDYSIVMGTEESYRAITDLGYEVSLIGATTEFPIADSEYHDFPEMMAEIQQAAADHPDICKMEFVGTSIEGRPIWGVKISDNVDLNEDEPGVFLVALHHAREHISPEVVLGILAKLTDEYNTELEVKSLVDQTQIWIVPMLNPDGGEYDIQGGSYHSWRKNRRNNGGSYGVDLNRNYSKYWGGSGSSGDPNSETYRGTAAFSEPETTAVKAFFESHDISITITYHSYGYLVLYPNNGSYDPIPDSDDRQVHELLAEGMADIMGYTDQPGNELYLSAGEMCDWAYHVHGAFAFTIELPTSTFYPGDELLPEVIAENKEAAMFVMKYAGDPYEIIHNRPLAISPSSTTIEVGESKQFTASGGTSPYTWASTNTTVATINANGLLLGIAEGTCKVVLRDSVGAEVTSGTISVEEPGGICSLAPVGNVSMLTLLVVLFGMALMRKRQ